MEAIVPRHEPTIPPNPVPYSKQPVIGEVIVDYWKGGVKVTTQTPKMEPIEDEI